MTLQSSLLTSVFGISVVFAVLVSLILLIYFQSHILKYFHKENSQNAHSKTQPAADNPAPVNPLLQEATDMADTPIQFTRQGLELHQVDEPTAALIMAIICDESKIPANELIFKSIRIIHQTTENRA